MKRLFVLLVCLTLCLGCLGAVAEGNIKVFLNGNEIAFDTPPQQINDRTMVPMRAIFEAMGAQIEWSEVDAKVTANKGDVTIIMQIGSNAFIKNGIASYIDAAPVLIDGRTLVPVRVIAESFGAEVGWEEASRTVSISYGEAGPLPSPETGVVMDKNIIWAPDFGYYTGMQQSFAVPIEGGYGLSYYVEGYVQDGLDRYFSALKLLGFAGKQDKNTLAFVRDNHMLTLRFNDAFTQVDITGVSF